VTNDARCNVKLNVLAKTAFKKRALYTSKLAVNLRKTLVKCYTWNVAFCGAGTGTVRRVDQE
jgi:hypothetical protein